jgi:cytidylate kinase
VAGHLQSQRQEVGSLLPVVLISRGTMSGGETLARCLAGRLSLRHICREDLIAALDSRGEYAKRVQASLARATRAYDQFSQLRRPYLILMRSALLGFIREGNVVYSGYAGHLLVPRTPCCLRVRISAPLSMRIKKAMERLGLPEEDARELVLHEDEDRVRWARFMYGHDIRDPHLYDIWFSLERMAVDTIASMIVAGLAEKQYEMNPEAERVFRDLYLGTSVEAALVSDSRTLSAEVAARSQDGSVLIEGPYLEDQQLANVLEVARAVEGVKSVEYQPGCVSSFELAL